MRSRFYSNFYIGWAVCLFTVLWFVVTMCSDGNRRGIKRAAADTGKFALMSLIAGALCAFVLLPVVYGMQNWTSSSLGFDKEIAFYHKLPQIIDNLSAGVKTSLEFGVANLYCGSAAIFFAILFVLNRRVSWKKKLCYTLLCAFMLVSFELNILDFIWHGLHFPNQLPGRQSFLYVFIVLLMAYEALTHLDGLNLVCTSAAMAASVFVELFHRHAVVVNDLARPYKQTGERRDAFGQIVRVLRRDVADRLGDRVAHHALDILSDILAVEHLAALIIDDIALLVHNIVVFQNALTGLEVAAFNGLLSLLE